MSRRYSTGLFVGALCCSYMALASASFAAEKNENSPVAKIKETENQNSDSWYGKSVFERSRSEYTSQSPRLGTFNFKPSIVVSEAFDDNIYASKTNENDDFITSAKPAVSLESDWSRHALGFNASGNLATYADNSRENYEDYSVGTSGRLDVLQETYLLGSASTSHLHEDRGSPNSSSTAQSPTEYNQHNAGVSFIRNLRRFGLKVDGDATQYDYENGTTGAGAIVNNNGRDRDEYKVTARLGYEIIPEYEAFLRSTLNERDYDLALDSTGVNRDSSGYEVVAGTALNLGGKTRGEVFAGYLEQDYDSSRLGTVDGGQFGANILWNATGLTSVKTGIVRGVEETVDANSSGFISTAYSVGLEHEVLYNLLAGINASYTVNDYESSAAVAREDDISGAGAELKYLVNRNASVTGKYNYTNRDSNQANQDYDRNVVSLGVKLEM